MTKKFKRVILLLPFMILFSITCNYVQKSIGDRGHSHNHQESIIHIHKHSHSRTTHSHYHSSSNITILDYFTFKNADIVLDTNNINLNQYEVQTFNPKSIKNKLFKPPRFS